MKEAQVNKGMRPLARDIGIAACRVKEGDAVIVGLAENTRGLNRVGALDRQGTKSKLRHGQAGSAQSNEFHHGRYYRICERLASIIAGHIRHRRLEHFQFRRSV